MSSQIDTPTPQTAPPGPASGPPDILGDYSTAQSGPHEPPPAPAKIYWLVVKRSEDIFRVKSLNEHSLPAGVSRELEVGEFMRFFTPEPTHFVECTFPALKAYLEENRDREEVLERLEEIGFSFPDRQSTADAIDRIIQYLHDRTKSIRYDQSRELSLYSIRLRKQKKYDEALHYCRKAFEVNPIDENIFFNMSRVYFEKQDTGKALQCITYALKLNPGFEPALKFKRYLDKQGVVTAPETTGAARNQGN